MSESVETNQNTDNGVTRMAKKQRSLLLDEGLAALVERYQTGTGQSFTRIITAAVLSYLFNGLDSDEKHASMGPEPGWIRVTMALERGEMTVDDIPFEILDGAIKGAEWLIKYHGGDDPDNANEHDKKMMAQYREELKIFKERKRGWLNNAEDFGGRHAALIWEMDHRLPPDRRPGKTEDK